MIPILLYIYTEKKYQKNSHNYDDGRIFLKVSHICLSEVEMDVVVKSMLDKSPRKYVLECTLIHTKLELDDRFTRHYRDDISKKCNC